MKEDFHLNKIIIGFDLSQKYISCDLQTKTNLFSY
jgi:hypothetical protein